MRATKVTLREKKISNGKRSLYLDYYPPIIDPKTGHKTRREFLGMHIFEKPKNPFDKESDQQTKRLAQAIRAERQIAIQKEQFGFADKQKLSTDFLDYFNELTGKRYQSEGNYGNWRSVYKHLQAFRPSGILVGDIDKDFLEAFKDYLHAQKKLKQNTKVSYYQKLLAALKQAVRDGLLIENPAKYVETLKAEETEREFLTLDEIKILAKTPCGDELYKSAFLFSALTGLRFSDIKGLKWKDVQYSEHDGHFIRFTQKKTKGRETLKLPKPAVELIGDRDPNDAQVFKGLIYSAWKNELLKQWVKKAKIDKHITFHCARHSYATLQLTLGTDIYTVSKLLGHKHLKTTQIYGKIIDQKKVEAVNKMDNLNIEI